MNGSAAGIFESVRQDKKHFYAVSGNIFDTIPMDILYPDFVRALYDLTLKKFSNFIMYDTFSGLQVLRGDKDRISRDLNKSENPAVSRGNNADALTRAFDQLNAAQNSARQDSSPLQAFRVFDRFLHDPNKEQKNIIVIQYADIFFQNSCGMIPQFDLHALQTALNKWALDEEIHKNGHVIFSVGKNIDENLDTILDKCACVHQARIPKPDEDERIEFLTKLDSIPEKRVRLLGKACSGLSFKQIQRFYLSLDESFDDERVLSECFLVKKRMIEEDYGDVLEVMGTTGFDAIGGLEKPIAKMKAVARAMKEGKRALVPQGIGFFGPPGTGKTLLMQAAAREAGVNAVRARDLKNMFLGESERRKTRFMNALRDVAPVMVLVDELDQAYKDRGSYDGDSGVSKDYFKKDLEMMSDPALRGKVLFIFASNRPDLIDSALKRPGRCDLRIPFPPFGASELEQICHAALVQFPEIKSKITDFTPYAINCEGYSGADIVEIVRRAWEHAIWNDKSELDEEDMWWGCEDYIPQNADAFELAKMTLLAFRECSSKSLYPDNWEELISKYGKFLMEKSGNSDIDTILYPSRNGGRIISAL